MKRKVVHALRGRWPHVLVIVTEVRDWGVIGYMPMPGRPHGRDQVSRAFVRIETGDFSHVGEIEVPDE
jgi:hypothetical protein